MMSEWYIWYFWLVLVSCCLVWCSSASINHIAPVPSTHHRHHHKPPRHHDDRPQSRYQDAFPVHQNVQQQTLHVNPPLVLKRQAPHPLSDCLHDCWLQVENIQTVRTKFHDFLDEPDTAIIFFRFYFPGLNLTLMDDYPYMGKHFQADKWVWASERLGRKHLNLPLDSDVLSMYTLDRHKKELSVHVTADPPTCLIMQTPSCRIYSIQKLIIYNLTQVERHIHRRDFVCHHVFNSADQRNDMGSGSKLQLIYQCCDTAEFRTGNHICEIYTGAHTEVAAVIVIVDIIAVILTLFSPVLIMKVKLAMKFDSITKFFRASLKHGITGQRNYVIRILSRQLINLSDPKPFSIPRVLFRLMFHCYGEGRCFIHWWGNWRKQPRCCHKNSMCHKCWIYFWRFIAVLLFYPSILYFALILYTPRLHSYGTIIDHVRSYNVNNTIQLNFNNMAAAFTPSYNSVLSLWVFFSYISFIYTTVLLSWPNNPLEKCMLNIETKRSCEQPYVLYDHMTNGYKRILHKLAYGDMTTKRHFFQIKWVPWGIRRVFNLIRRVVIQIPIVNIAFNLAMFDVKLFNLWSNDEEKNEDETKTYIEVTVPLCRDIVKALLSLVIWCGFLLILCGYCTCVYYMCEFVLNLIFFTLFGAIVYSSPTLTWITMGCIILYYLNDALSTINTEHKDILRLIDENSPRISAIEDSDDVFRDGTIQILRSHNLGAVKFIDGDNTEYVSKELYYNVCAALQCGWSHSIRKVCFRLAAILPIVLFIFLSFSALGSFLGSGIITTFVALVASTIPKFTELYHQLWTGEEREKKHLWARIMPDILDKHIRVDRTACVDTIESDLSTYDVRPVGVLEMDIPRMIVQRSLRLWKFSWIVSADQQTQSHEPFIVALANKLAVAAFLSKIVTRAYSHDLHEEPVLRQWCLLVENCILEGSSTASSVNGVPMESIRLFPKDVQPLIATFSTGTTIDSVVDNINRELYGPFTKGVLVTISNTSFALVKLEHTIFAFNTACHGDQVTDLFGAVLIATDFNTQNLQSIIKYIVDPYAPDSVPVYSVVPIEGFVFRSANLIQEDVSPIDT